MPLQFIQQSANNNPLFNPMEGKGVFFLDTFGKVKRHKARGYWFVEGRWKGKRRYFSQIPALNGFLQCTSKEHAVFLQNEISKEIYTQTFNPARYQKARPLHIKKFCMTWLTQIKPTLKYSTWKGYRTHIELYIIPITGHVFLADLNYNHYLQIWIAVDKSEKYRKNILSTLYTLVDDARKAGYISQVPEKIVFRGKFKIPVKDIDWIDRATQEKIINEIKQKDRPIFQFIMITGVRPSEARAMQKSDIHADKDYILIKHSFAPIESGGEGLVMVKQKRERRIPFYDSLKPVLDANPTNLTPFVFLNPRTGRPYTKHMNRNIWNKASTRALGYVVPLNTAGRHSFGNQLAIAGENMETIRDGLGHSSTKVTRDFYANPGLTQLKKAVDNVRQICDKSATRVRQQQNDTSNPLK